MTFSVLILTNNSQWRGVKSRGRLRRKHQSYFDTGLGSTQIELAVFHPR